MLMVACLLMTSGDRGVSVATSSAFRSCECVRMWPSSCVPRHESVAMRGRISYLLPQPCSLCFRHSTSHTPKILPSNRCRKLIHSSERGEEARRIRRWIAGNWCGAYCVGTGTRSDPMPMQGGTSSLHPQPLSTHIILYHYTIRSTGCDLGVMSSAQSSLQSLLVQLPLTEEQQQQAVRV